MHVKTGRRGEEKGEVERSDDAHRILRLSRELQSLFAICVKMRAIGNVSIHTSKFLMAAATLLLVLS